MRARFALAAALVAHAASCGSNSAQPKTDAPVADAQPDGAPPTFTVTPLPAAVDKVDLVLAIDNSSFMAAKQFVLAQSITDLITGLVNPPCVDITSYQQTSQPADPSDACPIGSVREHAPVTDLHIGLVSSSLGSFGADGCPDEPPAQCTGATPNSTSNDDHGHLVTRTDPCGTTDVPTYQSGGFLAWDPNQQLVPPGTAQVGDLTTAVTNLIIGDGQLGCGFESQDESWFRFLVDPTPYQSIVLVNNQVQVIGTDDTLLAQRKAFLRPDSLLAVVVVSDETDTSIQELAQFPLFAAPEIHLPHPSEACGSDTDDPTPLAACCYSCGEAPPSGCAADPECASSPNYTAADEDTSLRAFGLESHKDRYGLEFFYQPSRYVAALTQATVADVNGNQVPNPIYSNLDPANFTGVTRDPGLVYYASIVGVPWQLVARQNNGMPDLINGVSTLDATQVGGFKSGAELSLADPQGNTFWDDIAGDPELYVAPKSPFMVESTVPRTGSDPITGATIDPTATPNGTGAQSGGSLLNDHERTIKTPADDIEYACVFDLPPGHTIDCTTGAECDCPSSPGVTTDNPECEGTTQVKTKAYPGVKQLAIAKGLGAQGIVGSICSKQVTDATAEDFGYRPAMKSILSGVDPALHRQCTATTLATDANGASACVVVEARPASGSGGACTCDAAAARADIPAADQSIVTAVQAEVAAGDCLCEVTQTSGADLTDCETSASSTANGWCYVDAAAGSAQTAVVASCPLAERHEIRLVGQGAPVAGASLFLACPQ